MDQKDPTIHNTNENQTADQEVHKVRSLATAAELRGSKSGKTGSADGSSKKSGAKIWMSLIAMVLVLGVAVGVFFAASSIKPEPEQTQQPSATNAPVTTYSIINRSRDDVRSVTIEIEGEEPYTLTSTAIVSGEGDNAVTSYEYGVQGNPNFNLNKSKAKSIITYAQVLTVSTLLAENVTDFSPYGLDDPTMVFTAKYADGSKDVLLFGKKVPTSNRYYMCRQGEKTVYVIYNSAYETLHTTLNELAVVNMPITMDASTIENFLIEQKGKQTIEVIYDPDASSTFTITNMKLVQPVEYYTNGDRVSEIMTACAGLTITTYAGEKSMLPEAGLDDPRARIRLTDSEGNVLNYTVGNYKDELNVYVQVDDSETVYLAEASTLKFLDNVSVSYLIDQYTNLVNISHVDELTVTVGENTYTMSIERQPDLDESGVQRTNSNGLLQTIDSYYFDGAVVTQDQFKKVYMNLIGIMMSKVSDNVHLEGDLIAHISFKLNVEPDELVVEYMAYDDQYYAVRRDGYTLALVKQDRIDSLLEQLEAFGSGEIDAQ